LDRLGWRTVTVAGAGADVVLPDLAWPAPGGAPTTRGFEAQLAEALGDADLLVAENILGLPLNPRATAALANVARGRPLVARHHDLPWHRPDTGHLSVPDDPAWARVVTSDLARRELAERGTDAIVMRNRFDPAPVPGDRSTTRERLGVERLLVVQPTRAVARKNVAGGIRLAESLGGEYWLTGPAEDGYRPELERLLAAASVPVHRGLDGMSLADAYAAADVVALPSTWEGFGNPAVEGSAHGRPVVVGSYPVAGELRDLGFRWGDLAETTAAGRVPDRDFDLSHNKAIVARHLDLADLPGELGSLLGSRGW
jgi:mannosylglucosylglycerate synthase